MSARYTERIDPVRGVYLHVEFTSHRSDVLDYAIVLLVDVCGEFETVRLYDAAHGRNELHRHTRTGGKQPAQIVHSGSLGEGMRAAIEDVKRGYHSMIESWKAR